MWSLWTMEPSQSPPSCSTWGGMAEAGTAAEERVVEERGGEALTQETASEEDGGSRRSVRGPAALHLPLLIASRGEAEEVGHGGGRRGINCTHSPHASRLLRVNASQNCRTERAGGFGIQRIRAWAGAWTWRAPSLRQRPVSRVGWQAFRLRGAPSARGRPAARRTCQRVPALRLQKISAQATCLPKAGSQLPACRDGKLFELLEPYYTSKPDQLRGLLSE